MPYISIVKEMDLKTNRKIKTGLAIIAIVCIAGAVVLSGIREKETSEIGMFSWHDEEIMGDKLGRTADILKSLNVTQIYQHFDMERSMDMRKAFWETMKSCDMRVYYLCGTPEWAYPELLYQLAEQVETAYALKLESDNLLKGIVFDIEPYTLEEWEESRDLPEAFCKNMSAAYRMAKGYDLEVILCIPNFFDNRQDDLLEDLMQCCDKAAVMNYTGKDSLSRIQGEAILAKQYEKKLMNISEIEENGSEEARRQIQDIQEMWKEMGRKTMNEVMRNERKFLLSLDEFYKLSGYFSRFLIPDEHNGWDGYTVRSLYFDTPEERDYFEKEDGIEIRRKIRLRVYNPSDDFAALEMKQKQGTNQLKRSLRIHRKDAERLIQGDYRILLHYPEDFAAECYGIMEMFAYRPKSVIEYRRKAFVAKENRIRLTFDHHIAACETNFNIFSHNLALNPVWEPYLVVFEVKYNGFLLSYIRDAINYCEKSELSVSKYCVGRSTSLHYVY